MKEQQHNEGCYIGRIGEGLEPNPPYERLRGSKIYSVNLYQPVFQTLMKTFTNEEIGSFMVGLYNYINIGSEEPKWQSRKFQQVWNDTLVLMNKKADWWFELKAKQEYTKILTEDKNNKK
jgi:hypothetical protein